MRYPFWVPFTALLLSSCTSPADLKPPRRPNRRGVANPIQTPTKVLSCVEIAGETFLPRPRFESGVGPNLHQPLPVFG